MSQENPTHENRITKIEQALRGNGQKGIFGRIDDLEESMVTREQIPEIIRKTVREERECQTMGWNKWVNTILLCVTALGVLYTIFGG